MPYIKQENRDYLDSSIKGLSDNLRSNSTEEDIDGKVNYAFSKIMHDLYPNNYYSLNKAIGVLECIKQEFYRRVVSPYEDKKIQENGDI